MARENWHAAHATLDLSPAFARAADRPFGAEQYREVPEQSAPAARATAAAELTSPFTAKGPAHSLSDSRAAHQSKTIGFTAVRSTYGGR